MRPPRHLECQPVAVGLEAEIEKPLRLLLFRRDKTYDVLIEPDGDNIGVDVADKAVFILAGGGVGDYIFILFFHTGLFIVMIVAVIVVAHAGHCSHKILECLAAKHFGGEVDHCPGRTAFGKTTV